MNKKCPGEHTLLIKCLRMKKTAIFLTMMLVSAMMAISSFAQRPTSVPYDNEPLRVFESVASVIFYLVLPAAIIVLYIIWRRRGNK